MLNDIGEEYEKKDIFMVKVTQYKKASAQEIQQYRDNKGCQLYHIAGNFYSLPLYSDHIVFKPEKAHELKEMYGRSSEMSISLGSLPTFTLQPDKISAVMKELLDLLDISSLYYDYVKQQYELDVSYLTKNNIKCFRNEYLKKYRVVHIMHLNLYVGTGYYPLNETNFVLRQSNLQ